jgi:hypothetical protein
MCVPCGASATAAAAAGVGLCVAEHLKGSAGALDSWNKRHKCCDMQTIASAAAIAAAAAAATAATVATDATIAANL